MTDPSTRDSDERNESAMHPVSLSRRALLGLIVALWSAGSLSDSQATRLLYGLQGYGWFGYGGEAERDEESRRFD